MADNIVTTDAGAKPGEVKVTNRDTGESLTAAKTPEAIADAYAALREAVKR